MGIKSLALFKVQVAKQENKFRAAPEAKDLSFTQAHAHELAAKVQNSPFPPAPVRLDSFWAPGHTEELSNEIGLLYGRLPIGGKCQLHKQLIAVEIERITFLFAGLLIAVKI